MHYCDRPQIVVLKGEEAVEGLTNYIRELRENKPEELTEGQTEVMIKLAEGLIQAIKNEPSTTEKKLEIHRLFNRLTSAMSTSLSKLLQEPSPPTSPTQTISSLNHHLLPPKKQQFQ